MDEIIKTIAHSVNIAILPIIIIPVTGLCCVVFYNRLGAINSLIHTLYREMILLQTNQEKMDSDKKRELIETHNQQRAKLIKRSNRIRATITCCFSGLISFILSAVSIMLSLYWAELLVVTLILWMTGALLFATGLIIGTMEVTSRSLSIIPMETAFINKWLEECDTDQNSSL